MKEIQNKYLQYKIRMMLFYKRLLIISIFFMLHNTNVLFSQVFSAKKDSIKTIVWNQHLNKVYTTGVKRGVGVFNNSMRINYRVNKVNKFYIELDEPTLVYQAKKTRGWGFVQFPRLFKNDDEKLAVVWNMNEDDILAKPKKKWKYSKNAGKTWFFRHKESPYDKGVLLSDNSRLKLYSNKYKEAELNTTAIEYNSNTFNTETSQANREKEALFKFYKLESLESRFTNFNQVKSYKDSIVLISSPVKYLPNTLKYSYKGVFPNQLWGKMAKVNNCTLITCQYPYFKNNGDKKINSSGVAFFESKDNGGSWKQISDIPFYVNEVYDKENKLDRTYLGYTEPIFQVLKNNKIVCILRSSPTYKEAPMYMTVSSDLGRTWSKPKAITNNGVLPQLLLLENDMLVLSYGRPGVQVRFLDTKEDNLVWSDLIEMLRFKNLKGQVSCGYTNLLATSENSFLIVYSDFRSRDENNNLRKSIFIRNIEVVKCN